MQQRVFAAAGALAATGVLFMSGFTSGAVIISDDFNAPGGATTGFGLNTGVNTGIDPANGVTRLGGTAASGLRWMNRDSTHKPDTSYSLDSDTRLKISSGAQSGRISLSPDGVAAADFGPALGTSLASPAAKLEYDIRITMRNSTSSGAQRMSFGWGTVETSATGWDFGLQIYRAVNTDTKYTVQKRVDSLSSGVADVDAPIGMFGAWNNMVPYLIRVDDAGAESGTNYNSRVRVSVDDGATWIYDTDLDAALPNGFRFDGAGRFLSFDIAGGTTATYYDNFSIDLTTAAPEPGTVGLAAVAGVAGFARRRRG